jgi:hypothetical protein
MSIVTTLTRRLFNNEIQHQVKLAIAETENDFLVGTRSLDAQDRDRVKYDFEDVLAQSLDAWRTNPLARRIVGLTSQYVVGGGLEFTCKHPYTNKFLSDFWNHSRNLFPIRVYEWCDELTRTGNLFLIMSTDAAGMSYFRAIPADQVKEIKSAANDIEQELSIILKSDQERDERTYAVYQAETDALDTDAIFVPVAFHFSVNRPVGAQFGEPDLAPVLKWLSRYSNWLEDRARLNRFRTAFLYIITGKYASATDRQKRQNELSAMPPNPGSILVTDESEKWDIISAKLEASDANTDGLALKKMIAAGAGIPLHFLAEPESSTRTTAEAAGGPTYRHFEQRQEYFVNLIETILKAVVNRRSWFDKKVSVKADITVHGADISSRDNVSLAMAASNMIGVLKDLRDRKLIDDTEFLRLMYRFTGEAVDVEEMLARGKRAPDPVLTGESKQAPAINTNPDPGKNTNSHGKSNPIPKQDVKIDPDTGEESSQSNQ